MISARFTYDGGHFSHRYYGGAGMVFSAVWAFACTCIYGTQYFFNKYKEDFYDFYGHAYTAGDVGSAFFFTWIGNGYA
jgi:hypothetical protein